MAMNNKPTSGNKFTTILQSIVRHYKLLVFVLIFLGIAILYLLFSQNKVAITQNTDIDITPSQIRSIEQIGQWEFLAIEDEELVDTVKYGFFGDDHLSRIYYGSVRIGYDLGKMPPNWIQMQGDSIVVSLPQPIILDNNFIDEARTTAFFESGSWSHKDREDLYQRAAYRMRKRALSTSNMERARNNAQQQFTKLFHTMGFTNVTFQKQIYSK